MGTMYEPQDPGPVGPPHRVSADMFDILAHLVGLVEYDGDAGRVTHNGRAYWCPLSELPPVETPGSAALRGAADVVLDRDAS